MAFLDFLFGEGEKRQQIPRFSSSQQNVLEQLLGGAQQGIAPGIQQLLNILGQDQQSLQAFEAPALRQFNEEILPSIAERFTGMMGEGSQRSSAFGQQLGQAGAGLAENLAGQRSQLGSQALSQLQQLLGLGLTPQQDTLVTPKQPGFIQTLLESLAPGLGPLLAGRMKQ